MTIDVQWINDHLGDMESLIRAAHGYHLDAWRRYMSALERGDIPEMIHAFDAIMMESNNTIVFSEGYLSLNDTISRIHHVCNGEPILSYEESRRNQEIEYSNSLWKRFSHLSSDENIIMVDAVDAVLNIEGYDDLHHGLYINASL